VIAHVGTASTHQSIELARHAEKAGADCVASIPPYYYHHDERSVVEYFRGLVESVQLPVYVYNNPKTSGVAVTPSLLRRLAGVGVAGMKDSAFSYIDFTHFVLAMEDRPEFRLIAGTEGSRCRHVSGLANAFPEIMIDLWNLFEAGNYLEAARLQLKVNKARQILHIPSSTNAAIYHVLHERGIDAGWPKLPVLPVEEDKGAGMLAAFRQIDMLAGERELAGKG
jgi:N-acetylneuraminate lyase/4-hydroxy-tetrahydrodipicolinate synthase